MTARKGTSSTLARRVTGGALWTVGMRLADRMMGFLSTLVLARLLVPNDFGLVAMAMAIVALLETMTALGVESVLISKTDATREDYDTAWTINASLGVLLGALLLLLAAPAAHYYRSSDVQIVMLALAIMPVLAGFENIGIVDFRKHLEFHRDFNFNVLRKLAAVSITLPLAFWLRNHWALIAGMIGSRAFALLLSYRMSTYRPRFSRARIGEILHFSKWILLHNLLFFLRTRLGDFVIGRTHGTAALGLFNMANEIATLPSTELVMPINRAVFPGYSMVSGDRARLQSGFLRVLGLFALVAVPGSVGIALVAPYAVPLLLGPAWSATIPLMQLLAIAGLTIALQSNCWSVFLAVGKPRLQVSIGVLQVAILVAAMVGLVPEHGIYGAAIAYLLSGLISLPLAYGLTMRLLALPAGRLLAQLWRPLAGATVMYLAVSAVTVKLDSSSSGGLGPAAMLLTAITVGAFTYSVAVLLQWLAAGRPDGGERDLARMIDRRT